MVVKDNANSNIFNIYVKYIGSLNSKQSPINGVNKPFMGLFLFMAISVLMAPQILVSTKQEEYVMIAKDYEILKSDVEYMVYVV